MGRPPNPFAGNTLIPHGGSNLGKDISPIGH
jgi:hypothetical protein